MIIGLTVCAMLIRHQDKDEEYPKTHGPCPDKWTVNDDGKCVLPLVKKDDGTTVLGDSSDPNAVTFTDAKEANIGTLTNDSTLDTNIITRDENNRSLTFEPALTRCDKKLWANQYNIQWDGVSNYNNC